MKKRTGLTFDAVHPGCRMGGAVLDAVEAVEAALAGAGLADISDPARRTSAMVAATLRRNP
ncbi:MAG: hypothetical protein AAF557_08925 [Pseudomonadota bacterium]